MQLPFAGLVGFGCAIAARILLARVLLARLRGDVRRLNDGDHGRLLASYSDDAVLRFHVGPHRWSGTHAGHDAIDRFFREFSHAGLQGTIRGLWMSGPLWKLTLVARFDDKAAGPDGGTVYANRAVLIVWTRWGRIVGQDDFYEDTGRIAALEKKLQELGIPPALTSSVDVDPA